MTQDEIIHMAQEAGFTDYYPERLTRFAALVAAHEREKRLNLANEVAWSVALAEREACAKVCDDKIKRGQVTEYQHRYNYAYEDCAAAIRARGEK